MEAPQWKACRGTVSYTETVKWLNFWSDNSWPGEMRTACKKFWCSSKKTQASSAAPRESLERSSKFSHLLQMREEMWLMLPSQSCHSLVCAFSSRSEWGDLEKKTGCTLCWGRRRIFQDSCFIKGSSGLWWWRYQSPVTQTMRGISPAAVTTRRLVKHFQKWHHLLWDFFITFPLQSSSKREKYSKS